VKDIDYAMHTRTIHDGKGARSRVVMLPEILEPHLTDHLKRVRVIFEYDVKQDLTGVSLPYALGRKYPNALTQGGWQYVFPSKGIAKDPRTGIMRRHHAHHTNLQKAVRRAARSAGITKPVGCHTFRHSFATRLLEHGYDIRTVQELLGHMNVNTTMVYTHVMQRGAGGVRSPLDSGAEDDALRASWVKGRWFGALHACQVPLRVISFHGAATCCYA